MKNDRKEISAYYEGMPEVFEKFNQEEIGDFYIPEILVENELKLVPSEVGVGKAVGENASGERFFIKKSSNVEKIVYTNVLPAIKKQKLRFQVLQLPELVTIVGKNFDQTGLSEQQDFIITKYINGFRFNDRWDETSTLGYGGRGIDSNFATKTVDLVTDLSLIDTSLLNMLALPTFDFSNWKKQNLPFLSDILIKRKIINPEHIDKILLILSSNSLFENSRIILTNGDFYPRNFIELPNGKVAIVDWEGRQDYTFVDKNVDSGQKVVDQRNTFINFIENHLAFFYIHMWGNTDLQKKL